MWDFPQDFPAEGSMWEIHSVLCKASPPQVWPSPEGHGYFPAGLKSWALHSIFHLFGHSWPYLTRVWVSWLLSCSSSPRLGSVMVTAAFQPQQGSDRGGWLGSASAGGARAWLVGDCLTARWNGSVSPEYPLRNPVLKGILIPFMEITYSLPDQQGHILKGKK